jgi:AcrR family transcriptional regulator
MSSVTEDDTGAAGAGPDARLGWRAIRTREAILDASRKLFLERGYVGTRINNITDSCGISRAGFYTYFRDKREIFNVLGETSYHEILGVMSEWDTMPKPGTHGDVEAWVRRYWTFMDKHGAFILSAQSGPDDDEVRASSARMQLRVAWLLGMNLRSRQRNPTAAPEALGLTVQAMLERCWFQCRAQGLPIGQDDVIATMTTAITGLIDS